MPDVAPQGEAVGEEHRVEQAAFGGLRELLEVARIGDPFGLGEGVPPGGVVVAGVHQEGVEVQLAIAGRGHGVPRGTGMGTEGFQARTGTRQELSRRSTVTRSWLKATPMAEIVMMPAYICGIAKLYCEALIR